MENNNHEYEVKDPKIINNEWYVFEDSILSDIHINDCNTSVTGKCERTKNLEECLNICKSQQPCKSGYYIETRDENICVPLRESNVSSSAGPYYRLRNKTIYPVLKDKRSVVFSNVLDKFPPRHVNNIFYSDSIQIKVENTDKFIGLDENATDISDSNVISDPVDLQIIPAEILAASVSRYIVVKHGDYIQINIPRTAYILFDSENKIVWKMRASLASNEKSFQIFSSNPNKKIGDYLDFTETFYFLFEDVPVYFDNEIEELALSKDSLEKLKQNKALIYFRIIPKVKAFYCDNKNDLKSVSLDKSTMKGETAFLNDKQLSRSPTNWNKCNKSEAVKNTKKISYEDIFILLIICFLIFLIFKKFFGMKRKKLK